MKKAVSMVIAILIVVAIFAVPGMATAKGNGFDWLLEDGTLTIFGEGRMPDYSEGAAPWDADKELIKTVVISDGITSIGSNAFCKCSNLVSVEIPESVTVIGSHAFRLCMSLQSVNIPFGVKEIADGTFNSCESLTAVLIPEGVKRIGSAAFAYAESLSAIEIPSSVKSIDKMAFYACYDLDEVIVPYGIREIGESAFAYSGIEYASFPCSVKSIGKEAFYRCSNLDAIELQYGISSIEEKTFAYTGLESIELPRTVKTIKSSAFLNCEELVSVSVYTELSSIEEGAFLGCENLQTVYYGGILDSWSNVDIKDADISNKVFCDASLICYSQRIAVEETEKYGFLASKYMMEYRSGSLVDSVLIVECNDTKMIAFSQYLSGLYGAPVLLYNQEDIKEVRQLRHYIKQNLSKGGTIYILGDKDAIPEHMEYNFSEYTIKRPDNTLVNIAFDALKEGAVTGEDLIVCRYDDEMGILCASASDCPVMLVGNVIQQSQVEFILDKSFKNIYVIGGTDKVNSSIMSKLEQLVPEDGSASRINGGNIYRTSAIVAETIFPDADQIVLVSDRSDMVSVGFIADSIDAPVMIVDGTYEFVSDYVNANGITSGIVVGEADLISDETVQSVFAVPETVLIANRK